MLHMRIAHYYMYVLCFNKNVTIENTSLLTLSGPGCLMSLKVRGGGGGAHVPPL